MDICYMERIKRMSKKIIKKENGAICYDVSHLAVLNDGDLYHALGKLFANRKFGYAEAVNDYDYPTYTAKLAVIKHILLN